VPDAVFFEPKNLVRHIVTPRRERHIAIFKIFMGGTFASVSGSRLIPRFMIQGDRRERVSCPVWPRYQYFRTQLGHL
jgi:hypothetical protein